MCQKGLDLHLGSEAPTASISLNVRTLEKWGVEGRETRILMAGTTTYVLVVFAPDEDSTARSRTATSTESLKFASGRKLEKDMVPVLRARALGTLKSKNISACA